MIRKDPIITQFGLPNDPSAWTDDQKTAYRLERLKGAIDTSWPRDRRDACVRTWSNRIRKPEVLSEEVLRKRVEDEINGIEPVKTKKNARITQKGGLDILTKLLDRAEEANKEPFAYSVGAIILFGSWDRNDKPHAGDIDVAVEFIPKEPAGSDAWASLMKSRRRAAMDAGRNLAGPQYYSWPREEVGKFLQRRSKGISIVSLDQISESMPPNEKPFSYTILRGDAQEIARKFEHSEFGLKACRIRRRDPKTGEITTLFDDGTLTESASGQGGVERADYGCI